MNPIETNALTKRFGELTAIEDISLTIKQGELFGFIGPKKSICILCHLPHVIRTKLILFLFFTCFVADLVFLSKQDSRWKGRMFRIA